jgi:hypothetical protein
MVKKAVSIENGERESKWCQKAGCEEEKGWQTPPAQQFRFRFKMPQM